MRLCRKKNYGVRMKIIHCADVHLGSAMDSRLPAEKAEERKRELRSAFTGMVGYAARCGARAVIIAGDLFDSDRPLKKDKEFFYNAVKNNPQMDFLYLRGNHDGLQSYEQSLENLKLFSSEWTAYRYGNVAVWGCELTAGNCSSVYSTFRADGDGLNIAVLHGTCGDSSGRDKVNLQKLRDKGIDYLALGHLHAYRSQKLDGRGVWAYPGCLEGRGFDETGEKGFIELDIADGIAHRFVPFSRRVVHELAVDISAAGDGYAAYMLVLNALEYPKRDMVRVILKGETDFNEPDLAAEINKRLAREGYFYLEVKDETLCRIDPAEYGLEQSLKGEFVRSVLADGELSDEQKAKVVSLGLKALDGREIDL